MSGPRTQEIQQITKQLADQGAKLDAIQRTLSKLAVQDEKIRQLQQEQSAIWRKMDELNGPKGVITSMQKHQASCPRKQIHYLWYIVVPMGFTQLAMAWKILGGP